MIALQPLKRFRFPIIAECINPDVFQGKTCDEMKALEVWEGNKQRRLGDLFDCTEVKSERQPETVAISIDGDVSKVRRIGSGMKSGKIVINGNTGMHLGEKMKGGTITVHGNVGGWAGSMIKGGVIEVHGDVGDYLAAPYRGSTEGMHGGQITVYGNVGNEAGAHMKKGVIRIYGSAGQFAGFRMRGGTLFIQADCAGRVGACMTEGKIIVGGVLESVLPTFTIDSVKPRVKVEESEAVEGPFFVFVGDLAEDGRGKLYVSKQRNPSLSRYERFL